MEIKLYSKDELESIAEKFLAEKGKGHYDGDSLRIEPLIEEIGYTILPVKGLAEIAEAYLPRKEKLILVDEDQYSSYESLRYRFTLAEELAHIILHRPIFDGKTLKEVEHIQTAITDEQYQAMEKDAKHLAGALLMPASRFESQFRHYQDIHSQEMNRIRLLRKVTRKLYLNFNVSYSSACLRAAHLSLLEWEDLPELLPVSYGNSA